jgi:hypothetical protein
MNLREMKTYLEALIKSEVVRPELKEKAQRELAKVEFELAMNALVA